MGQGRYGLAAGRSPRQRGVSASRQFGGADVPDLPLGLAAFLQSPRSSAPQTSTALRHASRALLKAHRSSGTHAPRRTSLPSTLCRVWDLEMDMMCRRTLTGHKDDVTGLSAVTLHTRVPGPCATHPQASTAAGAPGAQTLAQRPSNGSVSNGLQHATSGGGAGAGGGADGGGAVTPGGRSVAMASTVVASSSADGTVRLWWVKWSLVKCRGRGVMGQAQGRLLKHNVDVALRFCKDTVCADADCWQRPRTPAYRLNVWRVAPWLCP